MVSRNIILDFFKGIAIIAVILYHAGILTYGYLGVEIFLVVGGYLITKSILHSYEKGYFSYWDYLCKRLVRLWPLALLITVVSLTVGYFTMLPDAFKNTCETAVGTSTFTNNFVQYITAGNYWDTANEFKPLMHTWYLGVIFQFYVLYPLLFMACRRFSKNYVKAIEKLLIIVIALSLLFYILPGTDNAVTFYLLPARLYEFSIGGILALYGIIERKNNRQHLVFAVFLFFVVVLLCINDAYNMSKVRLLMTVGLSVAIILFSERQSSDSISLQKQKYLRVFTLLGVASYSLYLWHQVILAFYRNVINNDFTVWSYLTTIFLSLIVGYISYLYIEKPFASFTKNSKGKTYIVLVSCFIVTVLVSLVSVKYYKTQGVVRDIPELEVDLENPSSYAPQDYNARITSLYEKPFPQGNGNKNVLVVGDSYARDWINILLESNIEDVNIVYSKDIAHDLRKKIAQADIIFVANNAPIDKYVDYLPAMMQKKFYRVGHKFYGRGINSAYNRARFTGNYAVSQAYFKDNVNADESIEFSGMYINLMDSIRNSDGSICLFTSDRKLISHDGLHLTRAGAKKYAEILNVKQLFR